MKPPFVHPISSNSYKGGELSSSKTRPKNGKRRAERVSGKWDFGGSNGAVLPLRECLKMGIWEILGNFGNGLLS